MANENDVADDNDAVVENEVTETPEAESEGSPAKKPVGRPKKEEIDPDEVERIRKALHKANKEAEKFRHENKVWRELGVDPDAVQGLLKERDEAAIREAEARQDWEELRVRLVEQQKKELAKRDEVVSEYQKEMALMQQSIEEYLVDSALAQEIAKEGVKSPKLLMPHVRPKLKAVKTDAGKYAVGVLDDNGQLREGLGITDLLQEAKKDDDLMALFPAPESSGSGSNQGSQSQAKDTGNTSITSLLSKRKSELTQAEKEKIISSPGGAMKYAKMKP